MIYPDRWFSELYAGCQLHHRRIAEVLPCVEQSFFYCESYPDAVLPLCSDLFKKSFKFFGYAFDARGREYEVLFYRQLSDRFAEIYCEHQNDGYGICYIGKRYPVIEYLGDSAQYGQQPEDHKSNELVSAK